MIDQLMKTKMIAEKTLKTKKAALRKKYFATTAIEFAHTRRYDTVLTSHVKWCGFFKVLHQLYPDQLPKVQHMTSPGKNQVQLFLKHNAKWSRLK